MPTVYFDSAGAATNSGTSDNNSPDLSGTGTATCVANATFVDANVNTGTNEITVTAHGYTSGSGMELTTTGTLPAGLTLTTLYYMFAVDADTITLHTNVADAEAGTNPVDITAAAGGGTHTINNMTLNISGGVDLSGVKVSHCLVTTTGTSHVFTMAGGIHGFTTGDPVVFDISTGGTIPTGITAGTSVYANALSATTFRVYALPSQAIAGGASGINVSTAGVRTLQVRSVLRDNGGQQSAINVPASTVANRTLFWLRAVSDTNDLIILDTVLGGVTGLGAGANWAIGGRLNADGWAAYIAAARCNDTVWLNTDISANPLNGTIRGFGQGPTSGGFLRIIGAPGSRKVITNQGNGDLIGCSFTGLTYGFYMSNVELQSQGTGSNFSRAAGTVSAIIDDVRVTDGGATQFSFNGVSSMFIGCEVTGLSAGTAFESFSHVIDSWVHDNAGALVFRAQFGWGSGGTWLINNIVERNTPPHIAAQGNDVAVCLIGNTIYRSDSVGLSRANTESRCGLLALRNIFKDNGNVGTEFNWSLLPNTAGGTDGFAGYMGVVVERNNVLTTAGGRGGGNVNILFDLSASDLTLDPLFVDPDNVTPADRNFGLQPGSPALNYEFTWPGLTGTTSYLALGAVQSQSGAGEVSTGFPQGGLLNATGYQRKMRLVAT